MTNAFESTTDGFYITFPSNKFTVSVHWRTGNHCDSGKSTAEVAIWDKNNKWYEYKEFMDLSVVQKCDTVMENVSPEELTKILTAVSNIQER